MNTMKQEGTLPFAEPSQHRPHNTRKYVLYGALAVMVLLFGSAGYNYHAEYSDGAAVHEYSGSGSTR